jgi:hypothetical protein
MNDTISKKIIEKINKNKELSVFSTNDFLELGKSETIKRILHRLAERKIIMNVIRGFYYRPKFSKILQEYEVASPNEIANAIARKFNWSIAPTGITALNILGLSTQVSAKWIYISDGAYRKFKLNKITIEFKHRNNREISKMSYQTALVIQAIKTLKKENIDDEIIKKIQKALNFKDKILLLKEGKSSLSWIYEIIKKICEEV